MCDTNSRNYTDDGKDVARDWLRQVDSIIHRLSLRPEVQNYEFLMTNTYLIIN